MLSGPVPFIVPTVPIVLITCCCVATLPSGVETVAIPVPVPVKRVPTTIGNVGKSVRDNVEVMPSTFGEILTGAVNEETFTYPLY